MLLFCPPFLNPPSAERTHVFLYRFYPTPEKWRFDHGKKSFENMIIIQLIDCRSRQAGLTPAPDPGGILEFCREELSLLADTWATASQEICWTLVTSSLKKQAIGQSIHGLFAWFEYANLRTKKTCASHEQKKSLQHCRIPISQDTPPTAFLGAVRQVQHPGAILVMGNFFRFSLATTIA